MNQRQAQKLWGIVLAEDQDSPGQDFQAQARDGGGLYPFSWVIGRRSLVELFLGRLERLIPRERMLVVVNRPHQDEFAPQLVPWPKDNIIVQPANQGTAPSILLALAHLAHRSPFATVAILSSHCSTLGEDGFIETVRRAFEETPYCPRKLTLLGTRPNRAPDGYVADASTIWEMVRQTLPELYQDFMHIRRVLGKVHAEWVIENVYGMREPISFFSEVCMRLLSRLCVLHVPEVGRSAGDKGVRRPDSPAGQVWLRSA